MREILFRGKNIYNDWIYGYLCQHRGEPVMDNNGMVLEGSDYYIRDWAEKIDTGFYGCNYKVRPSTVGQFTGLTDKNGKKVFEDDVIYIGKTEYYIGKEIYEESEALVMFCFDAFIADSNADFLLVWNGSYWKYDKPKEERKS